MELPVQLVHIDWDSFINPSYLTSSDQLVDWSIKMKRTAAFCIFLLLLSSLLAEGFVPLNPSKKKWIKQVNSFSNLVHSHYWCMSNESFFWVYLTPRVKFRFCCGFRCMIRLWILTQNLHQMSDMAKKICRLVSRITVPCLVSSQCCWEVASVWMLRIFTYQ